MRGQPVTEQKFFPAGQDITTGTIVHGIHSLQKGVCVKTGYLIPFECLINLVDMPVVIEKKGDDAKNDQD